MKDVFGNNVEMAPTDGIEAYAQEADIILKYIGYSYQEVFISDMSSLSDFGPEETDLLRMQAELGIPIKSRDSVLSICKLLRHKQQA